MEETGSKYHQISSKNNRLAYEQAKRELEKAYNTVTEEDLRYKIRIIEEFLGQHDQAWKLVKNLGRLWHGCTELQGDFYMLQFISVDFRHFTQTYFSLGWSNLQETKSVSFYISSLE